MIGKLQGLIDYTDENSLIIMVNGVGYNVFVPTSILLKSKIGEPISLWIETHVREDHIHLFGFETIADKTWFDTLQLVPGVGAKVALTILSTLSSDDIIKAVQTSDKTRFSSISGIGPKMAERIIIELKSKIKNLSLGGIFDQNKTNTELTSVIAKDAISALENLGYKKSNVSEIVSKIIKENPDITFENLIKSALKDI